MKQLSLHLSDVTEQIIVLAAFAYICRQRHKICIVLKDFFFNLLRVPLQLFMKKRWILLDALIIHLPSNDLWCRSVLLFQGMDEGSEKGWRKRKTQSSQGTDAAVWHPVYASWNYSFY